MQAQTHREQKLHRVRADSTTAPMGPDLSDLPTCALGRVMSAQANYYRVRLDESTVPNVELLCKMRSLMQKKGEYVLVGDRVEVMNIDWRDARAMVSRVTPRSSEIMDPKAANVDHFALVFSLADPPIEPFQVTRFLVAAESVGIQCSIILNKSDLVTEQEVAGQLSRMQEWGYRAIPVSVHSGSGVQGMRGLLKDRTTVLAGPSGVGKSSIINTLRSIAFTPQQSARLESFQHAMDTEYDWRFVDDDAEAEVEQDEDGEETLGSSERQRGDRGCGGEGMLGQAQNGASSVISEQPCTASDEASGASGVGESTSNAGTYGHAEDEYAPILARLDKHRGTDAEPSAQASWKRSTGNVYGAQAVGNVGYKSKHGRHTTRSAVLLDMPEGGLLLDTPGFNYPAMQQVSSRNVATYFPEIARLTEDAQCQFGNCSHVHEPGCVVRNTWERYEFYVRIRQELVDREEIEDTKLQMQKRRRQGMTKRRKGKGGEDLEVARLDSKKHRRSSRTARRVQVRDMLGDL